MKGKWQVQERYVPGVGRLYRAIRLLDTSRPLESGNVEAYGEYCEDFDAVRETVDKLNEEESVNGDRENHLMQTCPVCGREFRPMPEWQWKHGDVKLCRYNCCLEYEKVITERNRKMRAYRSHGRICRYLADGTLDTVYENVESAAEAQGIPRSVIRAYCNKKAPDPTGARWEYEKKEDSGDEETSETDT